MKILILIVGLLSSYSAFAYPTHMFWCGLTDSKPITKIYYQLEHKVVESGVGVIQISNYDTKTGKWTVAEQAEVKADIKWEKSDPNSDRLVIRGLKVDMGRTGKLEITTTTPYLNGVSEGFVKANLMSLNIPNGMKAPYCHYYLAVAAP